jgi:hypothetical protein
MMARWVAALIHGKPFALPKEHGVTLSCILRDFRVEGARQPSGAAPCPFFSFHLLSYLSHFEFGLRRNSGAYSSEMSSDFM